MRRQCVYPYLLAELEVGNVVDDWRLLNSVYAITLTACARSNVLMCVLLCQVCNDVRSCSYVYIRSDSNTTQ